MPLSPLSLGNHGIEENDNDLQKAIDMFEFNDHDSFGLASLGGTSHASHGCTSRAYKTMATFYEAKECATTEDPTRLRIVVGEVLDILPSSAKKMAFGCGESFDHMTTDVSLTYDEALAMKKRTPTTRQGTSYIAAVVYDGMDGFSPILIDATYSPQRASYSMCIDRRVRTALDIFLEGNTVVHATVFKESPVLFIFPPSSVSTTFLEKIGIKTFEAANVSGTVCYGSMIKSSVGLVFPFNIEAPFSLSEAVYAYLNGKIESLDVEDSAPLKKKCVRPSPIPFAALSPL